MCISDMSILTKEEKLLLLACIKRLVYSKDVITKEDKDVVQIINRVIEENKR